MDKPFNYYDYISFLYGNSFDHSKELEKEIEYYWKYAIPLSKEKLEEFSKRC